MECFKNDTTTFGRRLLLSLINPIKLAVSTRASAYFYGISKTRSVVRANMWRQCVTTLGTVLSFHSAWSNGWQSAHLLKVCEAPFRLSFTLPYLRKSCSCQSSQHFRCVPRNNALTTSILEVEICLLSG
jgi:hypothetical protein